MVKNKGERELIISKQILKLIEKWFSSFTSKNKSVPIFENPSSSDIAELVKGSPYKNYIEVRFICNSKSQVVYVWDAYYATHFDIAQKLNLGSILSSNHLLCGMCKVVNGKLQSTEIYLVDGSPSIEKYNILFGVLEYSWSFVDKYIRGITSYLSDNKKEYLQWQKNIDRLKNRTL